MFTLQKEDLGLELGELQELMENQFENFCSEVSFKQFKKLLRKYKTPATVVVVRNTLRTSQPSATLSQIEVSSEFKKFQCNLASSSSGIKGTKAVYDNFLKNNGTNLD